MIVKIELRPEDITRQKVAKANASERQIPLPSLHS